MTPSWTAWLTGVCGGFRRRSLRLNPALLARRTARAPTSAQHYPSRPTPSQTVYNQKRSISSSLAVAPVHLLRRRGYARLTVLDVAPRAMAAYPRTLTVVRNVRGIVRGTGGSVCEGDAHNGRSSGGVCRPGRHDRLASELRILTLCPSPMHRQPSSSLAFSSADMVPVICPVCYVPLPVPSGQEICAAQTSHPFVCRMIYSTFHGHRLCMIIYYGIEDITFIIQVSEKPMMLSAQRYPWTLRRNLALMNT